jgi:hypothetical protein
VKDLDDVEGKLGKQSWKGKMVGYMGRRGYRIYDVSRARVFQVRNVIFEEGTPHRTRTGPEEDLPPQNTTPFEAEHQPPPPHPDTPVRVDPVILPPLNAPVEIPPLPRRSECTTRPTRALLGMQASGEMEAIA